MSDQATVLASLDWTYTPVCQGKTCLDPAVGAVEFTNHPECNWVPTWHVLCRKHFQSCKQGGAACRHCRQPVTVANTVFL